MNRIIFLISLSFFIISWNPKTYPPVNPIDLKVETLLKAMTLEEKIGQMSQLNITMIMTDSIFKRYDTVTEYRLDTNKLIEYVTKYHIGSFLNGRGVPKESWFNFINQLQKINYKYSRLKIPILYGVDHVHGSNYLKEGTIFPHNINIAATFDTTFASSMGEVTAFETSGMGHNWIFAPVMDLGRNKFWGRYYETFGEDPLLVTKMGVAFINALQNSQSSGPYKAAACGKHFIGYSDPKSGWDRSPSEIPEQILREFFLPSFRAAIQAGVKTMMINSGELNGIPVHTSYELLTKLLREELGFNGVVVTDWEDIIALVKMHFVVDNEKEATYLAIKAGIDISMIPTTTNFNQYLKELVTEGRISEQRIDSSVRRILKLKYELNLFDNPFPDKATLKRIGNTASKEKALEAARSSIVLLKNEKDILPLKDYKKIVVTGATAHQKVALSGGWTYRFMAKGDWWFPKNMATILDAVKIEFPKSNVVFAEQEELQILAKDADVIIFAAGEKEAYAETDGSINSLDLSMDQITWAEKIFALNKPVILVLTEGRPRMISDIYNQSSAVLFAGLPGNEGGTAIAEILHGKVNPSAKMSFTYPLKQGHVISYNYKRSEYSVLRPVKGELNQFALAEFGLGLSYTNFTYSNLQLSDSIMNNKVITASVSVKNTGGREGKEAVLWFISDEVASITRPVKELQHFEKINLKPGETKKLTFTINASEHLSFPDKDGKEILERGYFTVKVGDLEKKFLLN